MKTTIKYLLCIVLLSITAEAGVLRELDLTPYRAMFPDSLKEKVRIVSMDSDFMNIRAFVSETIFLDSNNKYRIGSHAINANIYKFKKMPPDGKLGIFIDSKYLELALDTINLRRIYKDWFMLFPSNIYSFGKLDNSVRLINFEKDLVMQYPNIEFMDSVHINDRDYKVDIRIRDMYISNEGVIYGIAWPLNLSGSDDLLYKYENNKWEIIAKNKYNPIKFSSYCFTDNNELLYVNNQCMNKLNLKTMQDEELFFLSSLKIDHYLYSIFPKKFAMYYNKISDEIILYPDFSHQMVLFYNLKDKTYIFDKKFNKIVGDYNISNIFIDSKGTQYFIGKNKEYDKKKYILKLIVRDLKGEVTLVDIPDKPSEVLFANDDNIYFMNKTSSDTTTNTPIPYKVLVYNHYQSGVEDDYFGKAILFKEPYPNPVEFGKVTGNFFSMPFIIKGLTMDLYDITGKKILDLSNQIDYNPGTGMGSYSFSTDGLSKGMYYLIFNSSNYKDCKPIFVK